MKKINISAKENKIDTIIECHIQNNLEILHNGILIGYIITKNQYYFSSEIYCILIIEDFSFLSNTQPIEEGEVEAEEYVDLNYINIDKGVYKPNEKKDNYIKEQNTQIILHLDISTDEEDKKKKIIVRKNTTIGFFTDFSNLYYYKTYKKKKILLYKPYNLTDNNCNLFLKFKSDSEILFLFGDENIYDGKKIDNITIQKPNNKKELIRKIRQILLKYRKTNSFSSALVGEDSEDTYYKITIPLNRTQQRGGKRKTKKNNNRTNNKKMTSKRRKRQNKKQSKKTRNNRNNGRK